MARDYRQIIGLCQGCERGYGAAVLETLVRLVVTLAAAALPTLLQRVPLPGFEALGEFDVMPAFSLGGLGLDAVLLAFVLVEIAALAVPRWRELRWRGRVQLLRVTFVLAAALVLVQALLVVWLMRGSEFFTPGVGPMLLDAVVLIAGVAILLGASRVVTRWGTGHGLSVVAVLGLVPRWFERADVGSASGDEEAGIRTLVFAALGALVLVGREVRGVRLPIAGLVPLLLPAWLLQGVVLVQLVIGVDLEPMFGGSVLMVATVAAFVTIAIVGLQVRTSRERAPPMQMLRALGPAIVLSIVATSAIALGDGALDLGTGLVGANAGLAFFVMAVVVLMDVLREASLRMHVRLVPVLAFDDVAAADRAGARLAKEDIAFVLRGVGHRTLLRFFGPWVPVRLFVETSRAEEAAAIARAEAQRDAHDDITRFF